MRLTKHQQNTVLNLIHQFLQKEMVDTLQSNLSHKMCLSRARAQTPLWGNRAEYSKNKKEKWIFLTINGSNGCRDNGKFHHRCLPFTFGDVAYDACKSLAQALNFIVSGSSSQQYNPLFFQGTNNKKPVSHTANTP